MLLAPQHFQQSSRRLEMLAQYGALLALPYCWGVRRLSLDTKLLPAGTFRVLDLEAILPDGSVVTHRPEEGRELMLDLSGEADQMRQGDLTVHLVLPARTPSGSK